MVGKGGLIYIIGFGIILAIIGRNLSRYAVDTEGNMAAYTDATLSHNTAITGAHVALAKFYHNRAYAGTITQDLDTCSASGLAGQFTATVTNPSAPGKATMVCISTFRAWWAAGGVIHDTVSVSFALADSGRYTDYAYLTGNSGNGQFWYGGDTAWGPVHCNAHLKIMSASPVFHGKAVAEKFIHEDDGIYLAGHDLGSDVTFPTAATELKAAAQLKGKYYTTDITVKFLQGDPAASGDGFVLITHAGITDSVQITGNANFNGAVYTTGNLTIGNGSGTGKVDGILTVGSEKQVNIAGGDIRMEQDPLAGASDDELGIIAVNNIVITNTPQNLRIDAALFSITGGISASYGNSNDGRLTITGALAEKSSMDIMRGSGKNGYNKSFHWDPRFKDNPPPFFPGFGVKTYQITNWWESSKRKAFYQ